MSAPDSRQSFAQAWFRGTLTLDQKVTLVYFLTAISAVSSFAEIFSPDVTPWGRFESFALGCAFLGICIGTQRRKSYAWYLGFGVLSLNMAYPPQLLAEYQEAGFEAALGELFGPTVMMSGLMLSAMVIFWHRLRSYYMAPGNLAT